MKTIAKTSYLLIGTSFLLYSCTQEETPGFVNDGSDRRIVFNTSLPGLTSRAEEIIDKDLTKFNLTVYDETDEDLRTGGKLDEYYDRKEIIINGSYSGFRTDSCVWPAPGKEADRLHFFAYYPARLPQPSEFVNNTSVGDGGVTVGYQIRNFTVDSLIAKQVDFMTAYDAGSMADNLFKGITLNFRHHLSRVEVKVTGVHKSCNIEIAGVAIGSTLMQATFDFPKSDEADAVWTETPSEKSRGNATYIFQQGDQIVTTSKDTVSIMGSKIDAANDNCALLIPCKSSAWNYSNDIHNADKGLYLNVLLRILDKTPEGKMKQQYPYYDNSQGLNALSIPVVLLPVDDTGKINGKPVEVYKGDDGRYYTDGAKTKEYAAPSGSSVKEFGWAAVPITSDWEPGKIYTYTLDYSYGVGVHGPETPGNVAPMAGDPIISDRVGVSMSVKGWQNAGNTGIPVPGN